MSIDHPGYAEQQRLDSELEDRPLTGETITNEQIRELRELSAQWLDENDTRTTDYDTFSRHTIVVKTCEVALGKRRSKHIGGKAKARARCAEILNARNGATS